MLLFSNWTFSRNSYHFHILLIIHPEQSLAEQQHFSFIFQMISQNYSRKEIDLIKIQVVVISSKLDKYVPSLVTLVDPSAISITMRVTPSTRNTAMEIFIFISTNVFHRNRITLLTFPSKKYQKHSFPLPPKLAPNSLYT